MLGNMIRPTATPEKRVNVPAALQRCPLFVDIAEPQMAALLDCLLPVTRAYRKDEFIFRAGDEAASVGIVLSGGVRVLQEDFWGNRTILAHIDPGELFGEAFCCARANTLPVSVVASETSTIMLLKYHRIATPCSSACDFHSRLIMNMMRVLAEKNILLTKKLEHLSKRTTREKLLSFLSAQAVAAQSTTIEIPFNKTELAEYLCVDRSALSRELGAMRDEGLLRYDKKSFELFRMELDG